MTTPDSILLDLSRGRSTSESIGLRLRVPMLTIDAMISRHVLAGLVTRAESTGAMVVWKLTTTGHEQCPPPASMQFPKNRNRQSATP